MYDAYSVLLPHVCECVCVSEELLNCRGCEVCVCAEVEELRSQVNRLQSRNRELELQSSGRNNDHARQIRQVKTPITQLSFLQKSLNTESRNVDV